MGNNIIVQDITEARKGHYVHALEVTDVYELETCIESLCDEFTNKYTAEEVKEFFNSMQIYSLNDDDDESEKIYNFNIEESINENF